MGFDPHQDYSTSTVATPPSPATSGTSFVLAAAGGLEFPTPGAIGYRITVYPSGQKPTRANAETMRVTAKSTDTLTVTRAIDSSSARSVIAGDIVEANIFKGTLTDIEGLLTQGLTSADSPTFAGVTDSALTSGRVVLVGTAGVLRDDGNLLWDGSVFTALGTASFVPQFVFRNQAADATAGYFNFQKSRSGPSAVQNGDNLGNFVFEGYQNSGFRNAASLTAVVAAAPSGSIVPCYLQFTVTNAAELDTPALLIHSSGLAVGAYTPTARLHLPASTATASTGSLKIDAGTILTTPEVSLAENDGVQLYWTIDTTSGRGAVPVAPYVHLASDGGTISTIANFFGTTSNISLVASAYYWIEIVCYFLNTTSGTVTWTLTNSAAPTAQNIYVETSPITGIVAPPGTATALIGQFSKDATAAKAWTSGTLTTAVDHYMRIRIELKNGTGTSLKIQATKNVGGTITPRLGSYWICRRISPNNIGTFAA